MSKMEEDKGIVYCNRVLLGNWYEASKLEEVIKVSLGKLFK